MKERVCRVEWLLPSVQPVANEDLARINDLYREFVIDGPVPHITMAQLLRSATHEHVAVARMAGVESGQFGLWIVGMGTLYVCHAITGDVGRIGQFVVINAARGRGVGRALCTFMVDEARKMGLTQLGLTSDARRTGAHLFWERVGFSYKKSVVMRMQL